MKLIRKVGNERVEIELKIDQALIDKQKKEKKHAPGRDKRFESSYSSSSSSENDNEMTTVERCGEQYGV